MLVVLLLDPNGLLYLSARYADPTTGSFLSRDPVQGVVGGAGVTYNPYSYAQNNPVNMVDPNGEFAFLAAGLFLLGGGLDVGFQMAFEGHLEADIQPTTEQEQSGSEEGELPVGIDHVDRVVLRVGVRVVGDSRAADHTLHGVAGEEAAGGRVGVAGAQVEQAVGVQQ